jgi:hypothetical protein
MAKHRSRSANKGNNTWKRFSNREKLSHAQLIVLSSFLLLVAIIIVTHQTSTASAANSPTQYQSPKQQAAALQAAWDKQQAQKPHAPKVYVSSPSCPVNLNASPWIVNSKDHILPGQTYNSFVQLISSEKVPYTIYSNISPASIIVQRDPIDPCAYRASHPAMSQQSIQENILYTPATYAAPSNIGQITLYAAQGDIILFKTTSGTIGEFNFVTGQFLSSR